MPVLAPVTRNVLPSRSPGATRRRLVLLGGGGGGAQARAEPGGQSREGRPGAQDQDAGLAREVLEGQPNGQRSSPAERLRDGAGGGMDPALQGLGRERPPQTLHAGVEERGGNLDQ